MQKEVKEKKNAVKAPKRKPVNILPRLSEHIRAKLKSQGVKMVKVKHENLVTVYKTGVVDIASKEVHRAVKRLENHDRKYITTILARYYSTKKIDRLLILEKEIDKLELACWHNFAWFVTRRWDLERIRDVNFLLKEMESNGLLNK